MAYIQNYFLNNKMRERLIFRSVQEGLENNQNFLEGDPEFRILQQELESRWEYIREEVINGIHKKSKVFDAYFPNVSEEPNVEEPVAEEPVVTTDLDYIVQTFQTPSHILDMVPPHIRLMSPQQLLVLNNPGVNFGHAAMTPGMIHSSRDQYLIKFIIYVWCMEEFNILSYSDIEDHRKAFHRIMEAAPYPIESMTLFSVQPSPIIESVGSSSDPPPSNSRNNSRRAKRKTYNAKFDLDLPDARNQRFSLNLEDSSI